MGAWWRIGGGCSGGRCGCGCYCAIVTSQQHQNLLIICHVCLVASLCPLPFGVVGGFLCIYWDDADGKFGADLASSGLIFGGAHCFIIKRVGTSE